MGFSVELVGKLNLSSLFELAVGHVFDGGFGFAGDLLAVGDDDDDFAATG